MGIRLFAHKEKAYRQLSRCLTTGALTRQQTDRLDSIGMVWENRLETAWERGFGCAEAYCREHGDLLVPARYKTSDDFALSRWIANLRQRYANGEQQLLLSEERIRHLDEIGMEYCKLSVERKLPESGSLLPSVW